MQRVANRPIVCHALEALHEAGVVEAAIVTPPELAEEMAACIQNEGPSGIDVQYLAHEHHGQLSGALLAATDLVGDAPVILQRADGLLGQPVLPFLELLQEEGPELLLLVREGANVVFRDIMNTEG